MTQLSLAEVDLEELLQRLTLHARHLIVAATCLGVEDIVLPGGDSPADLASTRCSCIRAGAALMWAWRRKAADRALDRGILDKYQKEIEQLLYSTGAKLLRRRRHEIYRLQSAGNFVQSSTPSDWRRSRNSLGVLRRILRPHPDQGGNDAVAPARPDPEPQKKMRRSLPNWEPRAKAEVRIPSLGGNRRVQEKTNRGSFPLRSVYDLVDAAELCPLWWSLDVCGRIRVLLKLSRGFAKTEVVSIRYCGASTEQLRSWEVEAIFDDPTIDETRSLLFLLHSESGGRWEPALLIEDADEGLLLVETSATRKFTGRQEIMVSEVNLITEESSIFTHKVFRSEEFLADKGADEPRDINIVFHFLTAAGMQNGGWHFNASESWTNPAATRAALKEVRNAHAGLRIAEAFRRYLDDDESDLPAEDKEEDPPGEYSDLPLAIRYQALETALFRAAEDFAEKRHLEFKYDLTGELAKLTVTKRIEDIKAPLRICMPCEVAFCEIDDTDTGESEDVLFRPSTYEATRAHVAFDGNQLTAELIGAGIPCAHNGDMFNPDGYSFSDLDLV